MAGHEIYVESSIFTRQDEAFAATGVFSFDPDEQQEKEGAAMRNKILEKADQAEGADGSVVLFIAEGLVTTGMTLGRDPRSWAMSDVARNGGAPSVSAVVFAKDIYCSKTHVYPNANAIHPLPAEVLDWLQQRCDEGWLT